MSDHGHHDPGGHELEAINTKLLFRLLISLSFVTLLAAIAVIQWFNSQRRELQNRYAAEGSFMLADYKTKMGADLEGIDRVAADMAANPKLLQAPPAPSGWIHPDDLVGGAAAPAAPAEELAKDDTVPANVGDEGMDAPEQPDAPVEVKAETDEKPADDKPAADKPADDKPHANHGQGDEHKSDKADKADDNG